MGQYLALPTVLIVDDNDDFRRTAGDALREAGFTVREAGDGLEALRKLRREEPPELILLDLLMPVMDGWQLRENLTADPRLRDVPVVVTTAVGHEYEQENSLQAVAYLPKPCSLEATLDVVRQFCSPEPLGSCQESRTAVPG